MSSKVLFEEYFREINNLVEILNKYVNSYRLLIGGAGELNSIALARKGDVKDALKRVNELGKLIDCLIKALDGAQCSYVEYLKLKTTLIDVQTTKDIILTEIDNELMFQNATKGNNNHGIAHEIKPNGPLNKREDFGDDEGDDDGDEDDGGISHRYEDDD